MKTKEARILRYALRRLTQIQREVERAKNRNPKSTKLPLGTRYFRGKLSPFPAEREQMARILVWHEYEGLTITKCYFRASKQGMRNLRTGKEISRSRLHLMLEAERRLQWEEARRIPAEVLHWYRQGNSIIQCIDRGLRKGYWEIGEITPSDLEWMIKEEAELQLQE